MCVTIAEKMMGCFEFGLKLALWNRILGRCW